MLSWNRTKLFHVVEWVLFLFQQLAVLQHLNCRMLHCRGPRNRGKPTRIHLFFFLSLSSLIRPETLVGLKSRKSEDLHCLLLLAGWCGPHRRTACTWARHIVASWKYVHVTRKLYIEITSEKNQMTRTSFPIIVKHIRGVNYPNNNPFFPLVWLPIWIISYHV